MTLQKFKDAIQIKRIQGFPISKNTESEARTFLFEGVSHEDKSRGIQTTQKYVYFNEHMMEQFGQMLGLELSFIKSHPEYDRLRTHGAIAT